MATQNTIETGIATTNDGDHAYDGFVEIGDSVTVNPGIIVSAGGAGAHGIFSNVANSAVTVGSGALVSSVQGIGIALTGLYNGYIGGSGILVDSTATVAGAQYGATLDGSLNLVGNSGTIRGANGVKIGGNFASGNTIRQSATGSIIGTGATSMGVDILGDALVENAGLIQGVDFGINVRFARTFSLVNDGTIRGIAAINISGSDTSSTILNYGRIEGDISLGGKSDVYEGRSGYVSGTVYLADGNDRFFGSARAETIDPGFGNDTIDGGGGADVVVYVGNRADSTIVSNSDRSFTIVSGTGDTDVLRNVRSVKFADTAAFALGFNLTGTAGANALTGGWGDDVLSGGAGNDVLNGAEQGKDYLIGGTGNDRLSGGTDSDRLAGGAGNDTLSGGTGKDVFVFNAPLSSTSNKDRILDWNYRDDTIQLENAVFRKLTKTGALNKAYFVLNSVAKDSNDYVGYDSRTGDLWYDSNGNAAGGKMVFANIGVKKTIGIYDFAVI